MTKMRALTALALSAVVGGLPQPSWASGFAIIEQSVSGLGNAFAGGAASAQDATTVFYNPAGMTILKGAEFIAAAHVIIPSAKFRNSASVTSIGPPLTGGNGGDGGQTGVVPNLYYTRPFTDRLIFGLGINAPFGLSTKYDDGWIGRYHALKSEVKTVNINPSLAYKVDDHWSVGGGIDVQHLDATLTNAIDQASICNGLPIAAVCALPAVGLPAASIASTATDAAVDLSADDWGLGYNLGLLYEVNPNLRFGLAYRSKISYTLKGTADFQGANALRAAIAAAGTPAALAGFAVDQTVSADITLPEMVSLSAYHHYGSKLAVMGDITWTRWSRFKQLVINFDAGHPTQIQPENWRNNLRYSLGVTYDLDSDWTLRAGAAYDQTPIRNATYRTPRIPGNSRTWLAMGAGYRLNDKLCLDVGYAHLFVSDTSIANAEVNTGHTLIGSFDSQVDIVSAQLNWQL